MPTTIHVPDALLERLDARAKALGVSRNRFILEALEQRLGAKDSWSPELVQMLTHPVSPATAKELEETMRVVYATRKSRRRPPKL